MTKIVNKIILFIFLSLCVLVLSVSYYSNPFSIANPNWFKTFQDDSESLVLGKITADSLKLPNSNKINLGFLLIENEFVVKQGKVAESFCCNKPSLKLNVPMVLISDRNWTRGFSNNGNILLVSSESDLTPFIKGTLKLGWQSRKIVKIQKADKKNYWITYDGLRLQENKIGRAHV